MYESFFGLEREPFSIAPDPRFLYMSDKHREALAYLMYGLRRGGGFVLLTGEIGAGKTTVYRHFLEQLPSNIDVAYVANPKLGVTALLHRVCEDLRVELPGPLTDPIDAIQGHLLIANAGGRRALIVVDEAQALSVDVLEQMRLLTNLVTNDKKLLQILLIGQPELRTMLEQPALEPVAQRVVARFHLPALSEGETGRYVAHRLAVAGLEGEMPFDPIALARVHRLCHGVPRRINVLCDRVLFAAQAAGAHRIDSRLVDRAAGEVFGRPAAPPPAPAAQRMPAALKPQRRWPAWVALASVGVLALVAGLLLAPSLAPALSKSLAWVKPSAPPALAPMPLPVTTNPPPVAGAAPTTTPALAAAPAAATPAPVITISPVPQAVADARPVLAASAAPAAEAASAARVGRSEEAAAWRALAGLWGVNLPAGADPCAAALKETLRCYRGKGGLAPIRELDRPGLLKLTDERGRPSYAVLVGLRPGSATLLGSDGQETRVSLDQLANVWRGDFATFWRPPPGYREGEMVSGAAPLAPWLSERLGLPPRSASASASAAAGDDDVLRGRVFSFQLAHGLEPDGLAGPLTLMQISRASGIEEPRLRR
jgi:general secretion pathway protein A